jgi:hypothetical protein
MSSPGLCYHVTVAFRQGYGETFAARSTALEYADQQLQKLLAEYDGLRHEVFAGIYCELEGTQQVWRFEYDQGKPVWRRTSERPPGAAARRSSPVGTSERSDQA